MIKTVFTLNILSCNAIQLSVFLPNVVAPIWRFVFRKQWINAIEEVKRKLEEDETMETGDGDDSLNPFSKQGETQSRAGKRKVVSVFVCVSMKPLKNRKETR